MLKVIRHLKDVIRFNQLESANNRICFYSENKNYWPHLKPILNSLLKKTKIKINYVSSNQNDPGLYVNSNQVNGYIIGDGFIRNYFFENLKSELVIMTMPDLDQFQIKKSPYVKKFIYIHHSLVSHHMVYRPKAFDAFDVIMCAGPHHNNEIQAMISQWGMPAKEVINHGYGRLDAIISKKTNSTSNVKTILLAPSWGKSGTLELIGEDLVDALLQLPYRIILRPHPQTLKFASKKIEIIYNKHKNNDRFSMDFDISSETSLHCSDVMISDWSGAALDFAFGLNKPVLFMDVPKKVQNNAFELLKHAPFEINIREKIGLVQSIDLIGLKENLSTLLNNCNDWRFYLDKLAKENVHNVGKSGHCAAESILEML